MQVLLWAFAIYVLLIVALFALQRSLMYQPGDRLPSPTDTQVPDAEVRVVEIGDGLHLVSWYIPPRDGKPVVVYFQGNAQTIAERDFKARPLADAGYGVWLVGYRGFGGNPGSPTEQGLYADAHAVLSSLADEGVEPSRIVLYGESLGSGVAIEIASALARAGTPAKAIILEAPFTSMGDAAQSHYPFVPAKWLVRDRFDNLSKIASVSAPVLIMHGDRDRVVPQRHGKRLFDVAGEPKHGFWPRGGGHSDLDDFGAAGEVRSFLASLDD